MRPLDWPVVVLVGRCICVLIIVTFWAPLVAAGVEDDFISLPPEFASRVPARLVFDQSELIQCWQDSTAQRCVLKQSINLDPVVWRQAFQGAAPVHPQSDPFTLTSEPCTVGGTCLPGGGNVLHTINFNRFPYAISVERGGLLVFGYVQLFNLAPAAAYTYSASTPWRSTGQGTTSWPSIGLAPNATLVLVNSSILYYNPSDEDDCVDYTQKRIFAFRQVWGESNITQINSTANLIVGPQNITVTIRNGSTDVPVGNATVVYRNVSFICMETTANPQGLSSEALAAAIAVPVGVVLLTGGLVTAYCLRRRRKSRERQQQRLLAPQPKAEVRAAVVEDLETGCDDGAGPDAVLSREDDQVKLNTALKSDSFSSSRETVGATAAGYLTATHSKDIALGADQAQPGAATAASTWLYSQALQGSGGALAWQDRVGITSSGGMQGSGGTVDASAFSSGMQLSAAGPSSIAGSSRVTGVDDKLSNTSALLKARSDVAVLRDLRVGPLLGRGSYGRVYKGRWKATPVAVKIIEHHAAGARSSEGKAVSAGRETLVATSVSHPNVVTTYHISTMSISERSALASSWLEGGGPSSSQHAMQQQVEELPQDSDSDASSNSSDMDEAPPDLLETWVIMEFCEKGSLERAVRLGKFKKVEGPGQMVGIYKALLDTASGLDYLHSIGVVHGDLKTANVLLKGSTRDARGVTCKITDFGLSRVLDPEATHISTGTYGTIVYMPKELLLSGRMTQATDIYSFGLMMWELFTCQPVMEEGLSIGQMFYMIAYEGWRPKVPDDCPSAFAELMTACWHEDPEQRPTAQQLLRRMQKLYVQAKQQFIAASAASGQYPGRSSSSKAGRKAEVEPAACTAASMVAALPFDSGGCPEDAAAEAPAEDISHDSNTVPSIPEEAQQQQMQPQAAGNQPPMVRYTSSRLTSSIEEGRSSMDMSLPQTASGRRSTDSKEEDAEHTGDYQPYVQAILQRSTSVSTPMLDRLHTRSTAQATWGAAATSPRHPGFAALDSQQWAQLQQQLAQLQGVDPATQQELLKSYPVFVPPMLPADVACSMASGFSAQPGAAEQGAGEHELFDEDGLASESLMRQLTNPSNALYAADASSTAKGGDQFSGYLRPSTTAVNTAPSASLGQAVQQTVEQYRQQVHNLRQQSQERSQRLF